MMRTGFIPAIRTGRVLGVLAACLVSTFGSERTRKHHVGVLGPREPTNHFGEQIGDEARNDSRQRRAGAAIDLETTASPLTQAWDMTMVRTATEINDPRKCYVVLGLNGDFCTTGAVYHITPEWYDMRHKFRPLFYYYLFCLFSFSFSF
jgi:hypothetical protein